VRTVGAALGVASASTRVDPSGRAPAASSSPPGVPRRLPSSARSMPLTPTIALAESLRLRAGARARPDGPDFASVAPATAPSGESRCPASVAVPSARTDPSRASSVALRGSVVLRTSSSPVRKPGNSSDRDHAIAAPAPRLVHLRRRSSVRTRAAASRTDRVLTRTGTATSPPGASRGSPVTCRRVAVAVRSARS